MCSTEFEVLFSGMISRHLQVTGPKYHVDVREGFVHSIDEKNG